MNILAFSLLVIASSVNAAQSSDNLHKGIAALQQGNDREAIRLFTPIANAGDINAQLTLGMLYLQGEHIPVDYSLALKWYLRAFEKGDGDAYNDIGVMYRDGKGVSANRQIAYALFLMVHMEGRGTEDTQYRAGSNLTRLRHELTDSEQESALCQPYEWVMEYVRSSGHSGRLKELSIPTAKNPRLKDMSWWFEGELAKFECHI